MPLSFIRPRSALPGSQNQSFDILYEAEFFKRRPFVQAESIRMQNIHPTSGASKAKPSAVGDAQNVYHLRVDLYCIRYPRVNLRTTQTSPASGGPFLFGVQEPFLFSGRGRKEKWVLICAGHHLYTVKSAKNRTMLSHRPVFRARRFEAQRSGFKSGTKNNAAGRCRTVCGAA